MTPREPEAVAETPGAESGDDVAAGDRREHRGRDRERLVQALDDVEHDERPRRGERPLPRGVREQEAPYIGLRADDAPASGDVAPHTLEDAPVAPVLADEDDRRAAGEGRHPRRGEKGGRLPQVEQEAAADERAADRDPA